MDILFKSEYFSYFVAMACTLLLACVFDKLAGVKRLKGQRFALKFLNLLLVCFLFLLIYHVAVIYVQSNDLHWIKPIMLEMVLCIILIGFALFKVSHFVGHFEKGLLKKGHEPTSVKMLARSINVVCAFVAILFVAGHFGMSMSGLLAFGGVGGIAIGMASKDMLSNILAGVMLYFDRQFHVGDWIRSPDRNIEGTVVEIGWRLTKIMTFDHRPLFVPNALFSTISVENPGRMTNRRITATVGLRYEDAGKVRAIVDDIKGMLSAHPAIDQKQIILVYFDEFADSSLNIMVYCFTKTVNWSRWLEEQQDVFLKIIDIVAEHGADFAFPTQTLYVEDKKTP